jgi:hypothetical protein
MRPIVVRCRNKIVIHIDRYYRPLAIYRDSTCFSDPDPRFEYISEEQWKTLQRTLWSEE